LSLADSRQQSSFTVRLTVMHDLDAAWLVYPTFSRPKIGQWPTRRCTIMENFSMTVLVSDADELCDCE
jgi:hypothetical protein